MPAYSNMPIERQLLAVEDRLRRMYHSRFASSGADMASFATAVTAAARMLTTPVDHPSRFDHLPRMTLVDGSVWYAHVPGDPPPVSGELYINVISQGTLNVAERTGRLPSGFRRGHSDDFDWGMQARQPELAIVGWRLYEAPLSTSHEDCGATLDSTLANGPADENSPTPVPRTVAHEWFEIPPPTTAADAAAALNPSRFASAFPNLEEAYRSLRSAQTSMRARYTWGPNGDTSEGNVAADAYIGDTPL